MAGDGDPKTGWVHFRTPPKLEKRLKAEVARQRRGIPKSKAKPNRSTVGRDLLEEALNAREARRAG